MNERKLKLLRQIAQRPRTALAFTSGSTSIAPYVLQIYLDSFVQDGLCSLTGAIYTLTDDGAQLLAQVSNDPTPSRQITSFGQKDNYVPPTWPVRAGGSDHLQHQSRGV